MKFFTVLSTVFVLIYECQETQSRGMSKSQYSTDSKKDVEVKTLDMIGELGYPAEAHNMETKDGYILTMHRIPFSKDPAAKSSTRPYPIFFQHGLLGSSADFFLISTGDALPFLLSDLGFDIWLGNVRGNTYSRRHKQLLPSDKEFWNYTWHEAAINDIPTMIDYVLEVTQADKVAYIGYSLGTTLFFALASTMPDYQEKINVAMLMSPIAFAFNMKSPLLRFLAPISKTNAIMSGVINSGEFLTNHYILQLFTKYFCALPFLDDIFCKKYIGLIFGAEYDNYNPSTVALLLKHYPAGFSAKAINHYAQLIKSGKFQQYDYGAELNNKQYGSAYPPDYNLNEISVPLYTFVGKNDYLATMDDVNHTAKFLNSLRVFNIIDGPAFSHLDFLAAPDVRNLVYRPLIKQMMAELREE